MFVNDKSVALAAQAIWESITAEFWSRATPEQQRKYIGIARTALLAAGVTLA